MNLRMRGVWCLALASLLVAGLALRVAYRNYREIQALRLDPLELHFWAGDKPAPPAPGARRVVFYGDSRSRQWTEPKGIAGFQFLNRGVGHQTTEQALLRFDVQLAPLHPDIVVFQLGINDLKSMWLFPERGRQIVQNVERNIAALVTRTRALGAEVILTTIFPVGALEPWRVPFWSEGIAPAVDEVNLRLAKLEAPGVRVLVADRVLRDAEGRLRSAYARDHLHLTPAGYQELNRAQLVPLLEGR